MGKPERKTNINSSEFASSLYKNYFLFTPADTSQFKNYSISNGYKVPNLVGPIGGAILRSQASHNYYKEIFFVELFASDNLQSPLLIMKLAVDFDFGKKNKYQSLSNLLIKELKKNNFLK